MLTYAHTHTTTHSLTHSLTLSWASTTDPALTNMLMMSAWPFIAAWCKAKLSLCNTQEIKHRLDSIYNNNFIGTTCINGFQVLHKLQPANLQTCHLALAHKNDSSQRANIEYLTSLHFCTFPPQILEFNQFHSSHYNDHNQSTSPLIPTNVYVDLPTQSCCHLVHKMYELCHWLFQNEFHFFLFVCLKHFCNHFLAILAGVCHSGHEFELPVCRARLEPWTNTRI